MIGKRFLQYRVEEELGRGAAGVVYRAYDERLHRDVALKVLPQALMEESSARRQLRREARALSKLNHPNIEAVHEYVSADGVDFLVIEYAPGATLAERIGGRPLPIEEVVDIGTQIAGALEEAHGQGVTHRDLNPTNIAVNPDGQVKVLDFGLATWRRGSDDSVSTRNASGCHRAAGTLPYMAPEQLRGGGDNRIDLFAAGAVLYEMATGVRAFPHTNGPDLLQALLHEAPVAPRSIRSELSSGFERMILKALEKDPKRRHASAHELREELEKQRLASEPSAEPRQLPRRRHALVGALILVVVLAATAFFLLT